MDESIFIAVSGIMKQEKKMEILSNNLANMNNVGFKKDQLAFEALLTPFKKDLSFENSRNVLLPASQSKANVAYVGISEYSTDNTQGTLTPSSVLSDSMGIAQSIYGLVYSEYSNQITSDTVRNIIINVIKIAILKPDTKIIVSQVVTNNKV